MYSSGFFHAYQMDPVGQAVSEFFDEAEFKTRNLVNTAEGQKSRFSKASEVKQNKNSKLSGTDKKKDTD